MDTSIIARRDALVSTTTIVVVLAVVLAALLLAFFGAKPSEAQDAQTVTIDPTTIGFGATEVTLGLETRTVTITNNGTSDLVIGGIDFSGVAPGTFITSIGPGGLIVGAGQSASVDISFDPASNGVKNAVGSLLDLGSTVIPNTPQLSVTGTGVENLPAATPDCTIIGTDNGEVLTGTPQADVICALGGADRVNALGGNDVLKGGAGNDRLTDQNGKDKLFGQRGKDRLNARDGQRADVLKGGGGRDRCVKDRKDRARGC